MKWYTKILETVKKRHAGRERANNIVEGKPSPKDRAKYVNKPIESWKLFIRDNSLNKIAKQHSKGNFKRFLKTQVNMAIPN